MLEELLGGLQNNNNNKSKVGSDWLRDNRRIAKVNIEERERKKERKKERKRERERERERIRRRGEKLLKRTNSFQL